MTPARKVTQCPRCRSEPPFRETPMESGIWRFIIYTCANTPKCGAFVGHRYVNAFKQKELFNGPKTDK